MADEKKASAKAAVTVAPAVPDGVAVKAPAGMDAISVGGLNFAREGDGFVLPAHLVRAAEGHIWSFYEAAERAEKAAAVEALRLIQEADLPGRIKALEQRLAALERMLGHGANRG